MNKFRNILVTVDGSDQSMRAVDAAISVAAKYDSLLTALHVIYIPFGERLYPRAIWYKEFIKEGRSDARCWLAEIQKKGKASGVRIESQMSETTESVSAEIARFAKENRTELVVVGSRGKSELEKFFLGSTTAGVLAMPYALCWL